MDNKKPWLSKTILMNTVIGLAAVVTPFLPQAAVVQAWIGSHVVVIGTVWSVLNIALRAITKDKISLAD
jgi:hypothetical protein